MYYNLHDFSLKHMITTFSQTNNNIEVIIISLILLVLIFVVISVFIKRSSKNYNEGRNNIDSVYEAKKNKRSQEHLKEFISFIENTINEIEEFDIYNSKNTIANIKANSKETFNKFKTSSKFRYWATLNGDSEYLKLIIELSMIEPTIWNKKYKTEIERMIKYGNSL